MRTYSSYLFDFDGTLTATLPIWHAAISKTLVAQGTPLDDDMIATHMLGGWNSDREDSLLHLGIPDAILLSDAVNEAVKTERLHEALLHTGVREVLDSLKERSIHRALVTNNFQENVRRALIHHVLDDMFDIIVTRELVSRIKPDPEMVTLALGDIPPEEAVMIGDTAHDVAAARAAGVTAVVYFPVENERYYSLNYIKSFGADRIIRNFQELLV